MITLPIASLWIITGILPLLWLAELPPRWFVIMLIILAGGLSASNWRTARYLPFALLAFALAILAAQQAMWPLEQMNTHPQHAEVRIRQTDGKRRHLADIVKLNGQRLFPAVPVALNSRRLPVPLCSGQRWQMTLTLRAEHSSLNEGGFDRQRYALAQHRVLTGRVSEAQLLDSRCHLRADYMNRVKPSLDSRPWRSVIMALGFGERAELTSQIKLLLRNTATAHLMAISGLHIGFAALLGGFLARMWQWLLPARYISYRLPVFAGLLLAALYTWLSGASAPAQRSLVAVIMWSLLRLTGRRWHPWQVWLCCLAAVLLLDPLAVLSESFWLSACAVAGLIFWYQWLPFSPQHLPGYLRYPLSLLHLQSGMMLLLLPLQLWIFHGVSLSAIVANLIAVPLVTLAVLPVILTGMLATLLPWTAVAQVCWWAADTLLELVFGLLNRLPSGWLTLDSRLQWLTLLPWLAIILWRTGFSLLSPASVLVLLVLLVYPLWRKAPDDEWALHMLDVGQTQAIVIERQGAAVLYDTGTAWPGGDSAQQTIIPWLQWHHLHPDMVILSHSDFDKAAGIRTLRRVWPELLLISPQQQDNARPCLRGQNWYWQGLLFQVHWPVAGNSPASTQQTCVIKITDGMHSVLLTGRLEASSERDMLRYHWKQIQSQVMLVPATGSNRASSPLLLSRINGQLALASMARYGNRQSSVDKVKQRYAEQGYQWYDTARCGQITLRFSAKGLQVQTLRQHIQPRWYHRWFGLANAR